MRDVILFRDLPPAELDLLSRQVTHRRYPKNALIFSQGDPGDGLYIVAEGHVSINRQNPFGDELIFGLYEPGEYFGELALFDGEPRSAAAVAVDDCTLLFLSRTAFRQFVQRHPSAVFLCLAVVAKQLRRCTDLADEIALLDIRSRLARRLVRLANDGVIEGGNVPQRSFRITQQHLANMLGATRESVNKHLNSLVDGGIIRLERGQVHILDMGRLEDISIGLL